jgi:PRC-barrel domain
MKIRAVPTTCAAVALTTFLLGPYSAPSAQPAPPNQTVPGWSGTAAPQPGQSAPPGGLVAVDPTTVVLRFYTVQPVDTVASRLLRTDVYNLQSERIGRIEDLVIGGGRDVAAVVIGVGGFLGIDERYVALPPQAVVLTRQPSGSLRAVVDATRDSLRNAPEFKYEGNLRRDAAADVTGDQGRSAARAESDGRAGALEAGASSFTEAQAKSRIEAAGYQDATGLRKDENGIWRARARRGGQTVEVGLDYRGTVGEIRS